MKNPTRILTAVALSALLMATSVTIAHEAGGQNSTVFGAFNVSQEVTGQGIIASEKMAAPGNMMSPDMLSGMIMGYHAAPHKGMFGDKDFSISAAGWARSG